MSCFDTLTFTRTMPDGTCVTESDQYQFKDFACLQSRYAINDDNKLVLVEDRSNGTAQGLTGKKENDGKYFINDE